MRNFNKKKPNLDETSSDLRKLFDRHDIVGCEQHKLEDEKLQILSSLVYHIASFKVRGFNSLLKLEEVLMASSRLDDLIKELNLENIISVDIDRQKLELERKRLIIIGFRLSIDWTPEKLGRRIGLGPNEIDKIEKENYNPELAYERVIELDGFDEWHFNEWNKAPSDS